MDRRLSEGLKPARGTVFKWSLLCCLLAGLAALPIGRGITDGWADTGADPSVDVYYKTPGVPSGPAAPSPDSGAYPRYGSFDNRSFVWFVTQQHTYFGGFVLALPLFCVILEFAGLMRRDRTVAARYDRMARDFLRVALLALSLTAVVGSLMLGLFVWFYPSFMKYMGGTFKSMMPIYAAVFLGESLLLIAYYYTWDRWQTPATKWLHATLGVAANSLGALLLLLANAWIAFMMTPAGVDAQGRYLGNVRHLLHSALWNPLNVHRFLADIMSGGAVVIAYAAYRFFTSESEEERAYYDWVGYVFLVVTVCALLPMPFAGYWLMRAVYSFRQSMGVTMMGGLLTWLFVVQALLIGVLFMGINYYLWQSMGRIQGGERYERAQRILLIGLTGCLLVWLTPHTIMMTSAEVKAMGGAQHPVIGNYGVMSGKNGAINGMICLTALSYLFYRRANRTMVVSWKRRGDLALAVLFGVGLANIVGLAVYGYYLPASVRLGLSVPQVWTTLTLIVGGLMLNRAMLQGARVHGPIQWGKMPVRGMATLVGLAAAFTWVMGLMGYIRSSGRLTWHVSELMADASPWAYTPSLGFAAQMVTLNMVVFWLAVYGLFRLSAGEESRRLPVRGSEGRSGPMTVQTQGEG